LTQLPDKTRASIVFNFLSYFELFDNPLIDAATSRSDFDLRDLRRKKMTIYLGVTNDNLHRLSPLLTLFYQQVFDVMTRHEPLSDEKNTVLLLMDEFTALGKMDIFETNIGLLRSFQLRVLPIIQDIPQLYKKYGKDGAAAFLNQKIRIAFTQNNLETSEMIAKLLGNKTIRIKNNSRKANAFSLFGEQGTESYQYAPRPLLLPQEIRLMPRNKALIMVEGFAPVYADKIKWYKESVFSKRALGAITIDSILPEVAAILAECQAHLPSTIATLPENAPANDQSVNSRPTTITPVTVVQPASENKDEDMV
jgi:type IV secretion system protein VirD4